MKLKETSGLLPAPACVSSKHFLIISITFAWLDVLGASGQGNGGGSMAGGGEPIAVGGHGFSVGVGGHGLMLGLAALSSVPAPCADASRPAARICEKGSGQGPRGEDSSSSSATLAASEAIEASSPEASEEARDS